MSVFELLSRKKSFASRWIGNPYLNRWGLHKARIGLSNTCLGLRRLQCLTHPEYYQKFLDDGVVAIPDFLAEATFAALKAEALQHFKMAEAESPLTAHARSQGFGQKQDIKGGFDRFDGGTLNRFLKISEAQTPNCFDFSNQLGLRQLYGKSAGTRASVNKFWLYQTMHGDEQGNPDDQKLTHRDTFHSAVKLWFFVEDVTPEQGPLEYSIGSHKMTPERMQWEYNKSIFASSEQAGMRKGGAFRAGAVDMEIMGYGPLTPLPVKANTLVLADIRGFHRRGPAKAGSQRFGIYANFRPHPFSPFCL